MLEVFIETSKKNPQYPKKVIKLDKETFDKLAGEAGAEETREHLRGLHEAKHNPAKRFSFYGEAAESVSWITAGSGAVIDIEKTGFGLRFYGGVTKPTGRISEATGRPIRSLAIPFENTSAIEQPPSNFKDIFFCLSKRGTPLLVSASKGPLFHLVKKAKHKGNKKIIPSAKQYHEAIGSLLDLYLKEASRE